MCKLCGKPVKSYDGRVRSRCGNCNTKIRRHRAKLAAIALLGGKCGRCGYDKHPAALEFHHPKENKEFAIGTAANKSWEVIKKEVLKCELICSNCHRIEHSNRYDKKFVDEAANYKGKLLSVDV